MDEFDKATKIIQELKDFISDSKFEVTALEESKKYESLHFRIRKEEATLHSQIRQYNRLSKEQAKLMFSRRMVSTDTSSIVQNVENLNASGSLLSRASLT